MARRPVIALLTDFGAQDAYVASMKGVVLGIAPDATIVDITHAVPPQDIYAGAFLLETCIDAFPPGTIYVCVVDPGVGTQRHPIVLKSPHGTFVGPDNGVFSYVVARHREGTAVAEPAPPQVCATPLPSLVTAHVITDRALMRATVSNTFHGRDVFAPVAAHLANGLSVDHVGKPTVEVQAFAPPRPAREPGGAVAGSVIHVDGYGDLITNLVPEGLPTRPVFHIGGATIRGLSSSYQDGGPLVALVGSSGYVEVALRNGNASLALGTTRWATVTVVPG